MASETSVGVDISGWTLYGREMGDTAFLLGPIVGAVTQEEARVLVEVEGDQEVTMEAFMNGETVCSVTKDVMSRTPTAFQLDGFERNTRIRVVVTIGGEEREAMFTTTCNKLQWKIATVSCNCLTHAEKLGLWERLSRVVGDVDCILHLGDQVYGDSDLGVRESGEPFLSAWASSLELLEPLCEDEWEEHAEEIKEFYRGTYRITWNIPFVAKVLASAANYMICDDHEFTDDLGDEPEHRDPSTVHFFVARLAYQVYNEYQRQLLEDVDVTDASIKPYYAFKLSPRVGFFMTDNRVERSLHRDQEDDSAWEDKQFLGPHQWERMTEVFENEFEDCNMVLFGTPTPLVFISQKATWLAQTVIDDARGTWGHPDFESEQMAVASMLNKWQNGHRNRAVLTVGGDLHMGGFTDSWHEGSDVPLHQITASAVGNEPEGNIEGVKEHIIRGAMHGDENLFDFKVDHHGWIYGPNFGMVDFILAKHGHRRPKVTLTLVPHEGDPKLRNLTLGKSDVDVDDAEYSDAASSAHAYAETLGLPTD